VWFSRFCVHGRVVLSLGMRRVCKSLLSFYSWPVLFTFRGGCLRCGGSFRLGRCRASEAFLWDSLPRLSPFCPPLSQQEMGSGRWDPGMSSAAPLASRFSADHVRWGHPQSSPRRCFPKDVAVSGFGLSRAPALVLGWPARSKDCERVLRSCFLEAGVCYASRCRLLYVSAFLARPPAANWRDLLVYLRGVLLKILRWFRGLFVLGWRDLRLSCPSVLPIASLSVK